MGNVIQMESVSKTALIGALAEKDVEAYTKALAVVKKLHGCTALERMRALDKWLAAGLITVPEHRAMLDFYEYGTGE